MEGVTIAETLRRLSLSLCRMTDEALINAVDGIVQSVKRENELFRFLQFQWVTAMKAGGTSLCSQILEIRMVP
ncbi:MAG: hypothetical protein AB2693_33765 [Candidatus Thiodiazotropha sp.]